MAGPEMVFQEFLDFCQGLLSNEDPKFLELIKSRYKECDEDFRHSKSMALLLEETKQKMSSEKSRLFVHLKKFLMSLKDRRSNKKKGSASDRHRKGNGRDLLREEINADCIVVLENIHERIPMLSKTGIDNLSLSPSKEISEKVCIVTDGQERLADVISVANESQQKALCVELGSNRSTVDSECLLSSAHTHMTTDDICDISQTKTCRGGILDSSAILGKRDRVSHPTCSLSELSDGDDEDGSQETDSGGRKSCSTPLPISINSLVFSHEKHKSACHRDADLHERDLYGAFEDGGDSSNRSIEIERQYGLADDGGDDFTSVSRFEGAFSSWPTKRMDTSKRIVSIKEFNTADSIIRILPSCFPDKQVPFSQKYPVCQVDDDFRNLSAISHLDPWRAFMDQSDNPDEKKIKASEAVFIVGSKSGDVEPIVLPCFPYTSKVSCSDREKRHTIGSYTLNDKNRIKHLKVDENIILDSKISCPCSSVIFRDAKTLASSLSQTESVTAAASPATPPDGQWQGEIIPPIGKETPNTSPDGGDSPGAHRDFSGKVVSSSSIVPDTVFTSDANGLLSGDEKQDPPTQEALSSQLNQVVVSDTLELEAAPVDTGAVCIDTEGASMDTGVISIDCEDISMDTGVVSLGREEVSVNTCAICLDKEKVSVDTGAISSDEEVISVDTGSNSIDKEAVSVVTTDSDPVVVNKITISTGKYSDKDKFSTEHLLLQHKSDVEKDSAYLGKSAISEVSGSPTFTSKFNVARPASDRVSNTKTMEDETDSVSRGAGTGLICRSNVGDMDSGDINGKTDNCDDDDDDVVVVSMVDFSPSVKAPPSPSPQDKAKGRRVPIVSLNKIDKEDGSQSKCFFMGSLSLHSKAASDDGNKKEPEGTSLSSKYSGSNLYDDPLLQPSTSKGITTLKKKRKSSEGKLEMDAKQFTSSTASNTEQKTSTSEDLEKLNKQVRKLENFLEKLRDEIEKCQTRELSLDDLDAEDSSYMYEDRYKKKFVACWARLCELKKQTAATGRPTERRIRYDGTRYEEINRRLERFLNKHKIFPDFHDVKTVVKMTNKKYKLGLSVNKINDLSREAFVDIGKMLQKRRHDDFIASFGSRETDTQLQGPDPAFRDVSLRQKLEANRKIGTANLENVIEKYTQMQYNMDSDKNSCSEEEEEEEEEDDNLISVKALDVELDDDEEKEETPDWRKEKKKKRRRLESDDEDGDGREECVENHEPMEEEEDVEDFPMPSIEVDIACDDAVDIFETPSSIEGKDNDKDSPQKVADRHTDRRDECKTEGKNVSNISKFTNGWGESTDSYKNTKGNGKDLPGGKDAKSSCATQSPKSLSDEEKEEEYSDVMIIESGSSVDANKEPLTSQKPPDSPVSISSIDSDANDERDDVERVPAPKECDADYDVLSRKDSPGANQGETGRRSKEMDKIKANVGTLDLSQTSFDVTSTKEMKKSKELISTCHEIPGKEVASRDSPGLGEDCDNLMSKDKKDGKSKTGGATADVSGATGSLHKSPTSHLASPQSDADCNKRLSEGSPDSRLGGEVKERADQHITGKMGQSGEKDTPPLVHVIDDDDDKAEEQSASAEEPMDVDSTNEKMNAVEGSDSSICVILDVRSDSNVDPLQTHLVSPHKQTSTVDREKDDDVAIVEDSDGQEALPKPGNEESSPPSSTKKQIAKLTPEKDKLVSLVEGEKDLGKTGVSETPKDIIMIDDRADGGSQDGEAGFSNDQSQDDGVKSGTSSHLPEQSGEFSSNEGENVKSTAEKEAASLSSDMETTPVQSEVTGSTESKTREATIIVVEDVQSGGASEYSDKTASVNDGADSMSETNEKGENERVDTERKKDENQIEKGDMVNCPDKITELVTSDKDEDDNCNNPLETDVKAGEDRGQENKEAEEDDEDDVFNSIAKLCKTIDRENEESIVEEETVEPPTVLEVEGSEDGKGNSEVADALSSENQATGESEQCPKTLMLTAENGEEITIELISQNETKDVNESEEGDGEKSPDKVKCQTSDLDHSSEESVGMAGNDKSDNDEEGVDREDSAEVQTASTKDEARDEVGKLLAEAFQLGGAKKSQAGIKSETVDDSDLEITMVEMYPLMMNPVRRGRPPKTNCPYRNMGASKPVMMGGVYGGRGHGARAVAPRVSTLNGTRVRQSLYSPSSSSFQIPNRTNPSTSSRTFQQQPKPTMTSSSSKSSSDDSINWSLINASIAPVIQKVQGSTSAPSATPSRSNGFSGKQLSSTHLQGKSHVKLLMNDNRTPTNASFVRNSGNKSYSHPGVGMKSQRLPSAIPAQTLGPRVPIPSIHHHHGKSPSNAQRYGAISSPRSSHFSPRHGHGDPIPSRSLMPPKGSAHSHPSSGRPSSFHHHHQQHHHHRSSSSSHNSRLIAPSHRHTNQRRPGSSPKPKIDGLQLVLDDSDEEESSSSSKPSSMSTSSSGRRSLDHNHRGVLPSPKKRHLAESNKRKAHPSDNHAPSLKKMKSNSESAIVLSDSD